MRKGMLDESRFTLGAKGVNVIVALQGSLTQHV